MQHIGLEVRDCGIIGVMKRGYRQLSLIEREGISIFRAQGKSMRRQEPYSVECRKESCR